ncbi:MAG: hypothetical protein K6T85_14310 [Gorillibacterium sp.]|nr:hypothetical protein [Gorillibacterium sp.]
MNRKQIDYQLNEAIINIFSRYVMYDGQLQEFATQEASDLTERFEHFIEKEMLKRSKEN